MSDTNPPPDQVNASPVAPAAKSVLLDIAVVAAFFPVVSKLLGAGDVLGLIRAMQTDQGKQALAIIVPVLLSAWRARRRVRTFLKSINWARHAPDSVVVVKEK